MRAIGLRLAAILPLALVAPATADVAAPVQATTTGAEDQAKPKDGWIVTVRAMGAVMPSFPGSNVVKAFPFPGVGIRRVGEPEIFSTPDEGFGFSIVDQNGVRIGPVANFVFRRGERDGLFGLPPVPLTHEVGGYFEVAPVESFRARAEFRQGVDGHKGFVAALMADVYGPIADRFTLSMGPRLNFGNATYANAYFSVTPFEALLNGRIYPYRAEGGFTAAGGLATLRYDITEATNATVFGGVQRLLGSVGDSPIPNLLGSRDQYTAGLSIAHSFIVRGF